MTGAEKILVVDDNRDNVELLAKRLNSMGFLVVEAYDGEEALAKVAAEEPDLVILDVMMPKMDGFEVCRRLKTDERTRFIPVILLTAKREVPDKVKGLDTGADDYVTKPFDPKELLARVKSLLQRRSTEQRHATTEKLGALGQMAEGVAHEVRNPMVTIGGFARRIHDKLPEADPLREYAAHIIKEVERLESMVEEIVRFKALMISPYEPVDMERLIAQVVSGKRKLLEERGIRVDVVCEPGLPSIDGDRGNLSMALTNLIENGLEAMAGGGMLSIRLSAAFRRRGMIALEVSDNGRGIPREELPNVFDPFFTSKMAGAGMGLTMVHRIVTRHGGEVDITSEPGKGTRVTLTLPVRQENNG
jgi:signal transduction histidine kinase